MNPRVYLRLLRPGWSLLETAVYGFLLSRLGLVLFHPPRAVADVAGMMLIAPLLWGRCLARAGRSAMYRPFFPVLPHGLARVRRASAVAVIVSAAGFGGLAAATGAMPAVAEFGVACALLSIPCAVPVYGWGRFATAAPLLLVVPFAQPLLVALTAQPGLWLVGGGATAVLCLVLGFSRGSMRRRSRVPYNPVGAGLFLLGNASANSRYLQEAGPRSSPLWLATDAAPWEQPALGDSTWAWMKAFRHAGPFSRHGGWRASAMLVAPSLVFTLLNWWLDRWAGAHAPAADYWSSLAYLCAPEGAGAGASRAASLLSMQGMFMLLATVAVPYPRILFPVTRPMYARITLGLILTQTAATVALLAAAVLLISAGGYLVGHGSLHGFRAEGLLALLMLVVPLLPLAALVRTVSSGGARILITVATFAAAFALGMVRPLVQPALLSVGGVLVDVAAAAIAVWVLRAALLSYYQRCDLLQELRLCNPFATVK